MKNILYIHGLKRGESSMESRTATILREALNSEEYSVYAPTFPADGVRALELAQEIIIEKNIDVVVGSSLGGFTALGLRGIPKIVINPCLRPDIELPKRGNAGITDSYSKLIGSLWDDISLEDRKETFGIFSDNDELFTYKDELVKHYFQIIDIKDGHRISEENVREVVAAFVEVIFDLKEIKKIRNGLA